VENLDSNAAVEATQKDAIALAANGDQMRDSFLPDYTAAHDAYRMALGLEPRNPYLHVAAATAYIREASTDHERSKASLLALRPFGDSGAARKAKKSFNRAVSACSEALKINPNHFGALFALAEAHARLDDFPQALVHFDDIEKRKLIPVRHEAAFYAWRGYVKLNLGQRSSAFRDFEMAIEYGRPHPYAEYADYMINPPGFLEAISDGSTLLSFIVGSGGPSLPAVVVPD
jgi:tetratricopeptide (TPR) repeat protein